MSGAPTLINLPPPPSDPVTPSDIPGTPNSTTTSMSELSTVAIKDGHRGHLPHHHAQHSTFPSSTSTNTLDAERADRISRLAGLERVTTARNPAPGLTGNLTPGAVASQPYGGYFDQNQSTAMGKERSTVGSASAIGSVGGRTTWASGSDTVDPERDRMSESQDMDMDRDVSSVGGMSDEVETGGSLVGFGEGARTPARQSGYSAGGGSNSPGVGRTPTASASALPQYMTSSTPTSSSATTPSTEQAQRDARMIDGLTYDENVVDTAGRRRATGAETTERIVRERLARGEDASGDRAMTSPDETGEGGKELGRFYFEGK
ncbi:hypothetical protein LTR04_005385 [Oleoguttula sp. CCFEE 6159]|nr:hypothetical protein LTR04_005385 [Oleoguttula sp. CCFEE 6159]